MRAMTFVILGLILLYSAIGVFAQDSKTQAQIDNIRKQAMDLSEAFASIANEVKPAVVNVYVESIIEQRLPNYEFFFGDPFEDFFGEAPKRGRERVYKQKVEGSGSGVIINEAGYVLTNFHVVSGADEIKIALPGNDHKFTGKVVGMDDRTDLAVVKINNPGRKLPYAKLGNSDDVEVGNMVLAIGAPFGLEQTVTSGIISAKRQSIDIGDRKYKYMLQTDAAINMGNSGGPLINLKGEVIGINSAIWAPTGVFAGIGFAIPVNLAKEIVSDLITKGKVVRGWLGIGISKVDTGVASGLGLKKASGALVTGVLPGSPAEKAGIKRGDVITAVQGADVPDDFELRTKIGALSPDSTVKLSISRAGKELVISAQLGEAPPDSSASREPSRREKQPKEKPGQRAEITWLSATFITLTPELREQLEIEPAVSGVIVKEIDPDSRLAGSLREGDCIKSVNNIDIASIADFEKATKSLSFKKGLLFDIVREGRSIYVSVADSE